MAHVIIKRGLEAQEVPSRLQQVTGSGKYRTYLQNSHQRAQRLTLSKVLNNMLLEYLN